MAGLCLPLGVYVLAVFSWAWGDPTLQGFFRVSVIRRVLLCPLVVSLWTSFLSLRVWQLASWVTSSRGHLEVFRPGPRPEITPQGGHCRLLLPALPWAIWVTAGQPSWPAPTGTQGFPSYGVRQGHSLGTCVGPYPPGPSILAQQKQVSPTGSPHPTRNRKNTTDCFL